MYCLCAGRQSEIICAIAFSKTKKKEMYSSMQVFRTPNRGWGVRSWDHIPPGAPICEYKGVLMRTDELDTVVQDTFVFEIDCLQTMKGLDGREVRSLEVVLDGVFYFVCSIQLAIAFSAFV